MINNQRGFALLNVIFLMMITSFAAMILLNAAPRVRNPEPTLRLTALYLAEEQFAYLEDKAAKGELTAGSYDFPSEYNSDLTSRNFSEKIPVEFNVVAHVTEHNAELPNLFDAKVTVSWTVGGKDFDIETERTILLVEQPEPETEEPEAEEENP